MFIYITSYGVVVVVVVVVVVIVVVVVLVFLSCVLHRIEEK